MQVLLRGACVLAVLAALPAEGARPAPPPKAVVSFTFDDGKPSVFLNAFPALAARGMPATMYLVTRDFPGYTEWHVNPDQVRIMRAQGWEIGSHTHTHPSLTKVAPVQALQEMQESKRVLLAHGINAVSFASPFGDTDPTVTQLMRQEYRSNRQAWGGGDNAGLNPIVGFDPYAIAALDVNQSVPPSQVAALLDKALSGNQWLVLLFHHVTEGELRHPTEYPAEKFRDIVEAVRVRQAAGLQVRTISAHVAGSR